MKNSLIACLIVSAAALTSVARSAAPAAAPPACNRACLESYVDRYLAAMEANNVDPQLFARNVKFTENGVQLPLGNEGLWVRMSGRGSYKFYVPDIETQQIAYFGTVREGGNATTAADPVGLVLRLKIVDQRITEVEQLAVRPSNQASARAGAAERPPMAVSVEKMGEQFGVPHPIFLEVIPEAKRPSREELIKTANYYFAGLQRNDGKGYYPFTDDCVRYENGTLTTQIPQRDAETGQTVTLGCKGQFERTQRNIVSRIRDRRFVAVDRERGIVFAFGFFDHHNINWTWQLGELFKIEDGQIRRVEAMFHRAAFGINSGWSTYEQGMSEEPQDIR